MQGDFTVAELSIGLLNKDELTAAVLPSGYFSIRAFRWMHY